MKKLCFKGFLFLGIFIWLDCLRKGLVVSILLGTLDSHEIYCCQFKFGLCVCGRYQLGICAEVAVLGWLFNS